MAQNEQRINLTDIIHMIGDDNRVITSPHPNRLIQRDAASDNRMEGRRNARDILIEESRKLNITADRVQPARTLTPYKAPPPLSIMSHSQNNDIGHISLNTSQTDTNQGTIRIDPFYSLETQYVPSKNVVPSIPITEISYGKSIIITFSNENINDETVFSIDRLIELQTNRRHNYVCEYYDLVELSGIMDPSMEPAGVLVIRNGAELLMNMGGINDSKTDDLCLEYSIFNHDTNEKIHTSVSTGVNIDKRKIKDLSSLYLLNSVRKGIVKLIDNTDQISIDSTTYTNMKEYTMFYRGEKQKSFIIYLQLGVSIPLSYKWYHFGVSVGNEIHIPDLRNGDICIPSYKAMGLDYRSRSKYTIRHSIVDTKTVK